MALYTIGYSGFSLPDFLALLKQRGISLVVDVRSQPHSRFYSDYDKEALSRTLKGEGLYYRNYDREFGARQTGPRYASPGGYLDFFDIANEVSVGRALLVVSLPDIPYEGKFFKFVAKIFPLNPW